jgi:hypothetical protein
MSEIYPSVRLAIRDSVTRILFDRPGQWLTTAELLNYCEEAETSDALAKILSDMAKTGRLMRGLKTLNAQGREVNTWGLSSKLRDKIMAGQLLAQSQDATEAPPLPVESREDEAASRAPEAPRGAQTIRELMCSVPEYAALERPLPAESPEDEAPYAPISAPDQPRPDWDIAAVIADYSDYKPLPPTAQEAATDIHIHYHPLPERWLPELRLRLLGYDGAADPEIILRIVTEGGGAYLTLSTRGKIAFDPGELDFLPSIGTALCQFVDALYPYGTTRPTAAATTPSAPDQP